MMKRTPRMLQMLAALACLIASHALAQTAGRPLTLVVPFAAGAANDVLARTLATELKDDLGVVIVDNKPGADGAIGAQAVKRAAPDGRTLLVAPNQYTIAAAVGAARGYDFVQDFEPVIQTNNLAFFLVVNREVLPAATVADFVRLARERGAALTFGSAGEASPHRFGAEMLKRAIGIQPVHVPYKGMAQGIPDLLEGRIQFVVTGLPAVATQLKSGKLAVLATTEPRRSAIRPDVPTFAEAGVPGVVMETWQGILAPAGTPRAEIERLNAAFNRVLKLPAIREKLLAQGIEVAGGTPEQFRALIAEDIARFRKVAQAANIKLD